jgi:hypothetical protein
MTGHTDADAKPAQLLAELATLPKADWTSSTQWTTISLLTSPDREALLAFLPLATDPTGTISLTLLSALLTLPGTWPAFDLALALGRITRALPETIKTDGNGNSPLSHLRTQIKLLQPSLANLIPTSTKPALCSGSDPEGEYITHAQLATFVRGLHVPVSRHNTDSTTASSNHGSHASRDTKQKPVVAIALPNGPLLAATCLAVANRYVAAPINPVTGAEQFAADVALVRADAVLTTQTEYDKLAIGELGVPAFFVEWGGGPGTGRLRLMTVEGVGVPVNAMGNGGHEDNGPDDIGLVLFTSGTSGTKKVVPMTINAMISGVAFVKESWGLKETDVCLNMMPLYHVYVAFITAPIPYPVLLTLG